MSVAVVILTKNSERTISRCLRSILDSSFHPRRVVIVDGGSRDGTLGIVEDTLGEDIIHVTLRDEGRGLGYARDIGWRNTDESYVAMVDSDVIVNPHFFEEATAVMEQDLRVGGLGAKLDPVCDEKGWIAKFQVKCYSTLEHLREPTYPEPRTGLHTGCTLFRRSALEKIDGFDHNFRFCEEDSDVSFRLRKAGYKLCYLDLASIHIETGKRFLKTNFRYGKSVTLFRKHAIPIWSTKRKVLAVALFAPLLQYLVYCIYLERYSRLKLDASEKFVLPLVETIRQALRTAGLVKVLLEPNGKRENAIIPIKK
jgi:GT2 family glycosyltransferase